MEGSGRECPIGRAVIILIMVTMGLIYIITFEDEMT